MNDQDKSWVHQNCCVTCVRLITGWLIGSHRMANRFPFSSFGGQQKTNYLIFMSPQNPNKQWNIQVCHLQ